MSVFVCFLYSVKAAVKIFSKLVEDVGDGIWDIVMVLVEGALAG